MSTPQTGPPHGDQDADPTGMRDVLASLADPAPMPAQLADRICASLAQEQQTRVGSTQWQPTTGPGQHGAVVHDFAAEKAHRRPQQWIMAAAAVLAVGAVGTVVFNEVMNDSTDTSSVAAQVVPDESDGNEGGDYGQSNSGDAQPDQSNEDGSEAGIEAAPDEAPAPTGLESLGDAAFALGAQALLATAESEINGEDIANAQSLPDSLNVEVGNLAPLDSAELDNCAQAAGEPSGQSWLGMTATINGEEVVVIGDTDSDASAATTAWALDSSCPQNASAAVLKGPVDLP